jgi:hypothetical protein
MVSISNENIESVHFSPAPLSGSWSLVSPFTQTLPCTSANETVSSHLHLPQLHALALERGPQHVPVIIFRRKQN